MRTHEQIRSEVREGLIKIHNHYIAGTSGIVDPFMDRYTEPHRFYHNLSHIDDLLTKWKESGQYKDDPEIFLTLIFHDWVYDPTAMNNEEQSADSMSAYMGVTGLISEELIKTVHQMILDTKTHKPSTEKSKFFCSLDLSILSDPFPKQLEFENNIMKEYQFVDYKFYKEKRIEVLKMLGAKKELIEYVDYRTPNIGIYAGSFNPFHKGHYNILQKAEAIFDKVIVAYGFNPEKGDAFFNRKEVPEVLKYKQVETYATLLTDFIGERGYPVTLVRGLRNATDLQYETTFYRYMKDQKKDLKMVSIICDAEYEHISSSGIKVVQKFDPELASTYLP